MRDNFPVKPPVSSQRLRGGYYTPAAIGEFLATWAIRDPHDRILEPSCGDGELLLAASQALQQCGATPLQISQQLHGIELDPAEADKARARLGDLGPIVQSGDFFQQAAEWLPDAEHRSRAFDVVLGNPPFIRYQNFDEDQRHLAFRLMQRAGLRPSRLTNAWVPFVCVAAQLLGPKGRLALVLFGLPRFNRSAIHLSVKVVSSRALPAIANFSGSLPCGRPDSCRDRSHPHSQFSACAA